MATVCGATKLYRAVYVFAMMARMWRCQRLAFDRWKYSTARIVGLSMAIEGVRPPSSPNQLKQSVIERASLLWLAGRAERLRKAVRRQRAVFN